MGSSKTSHKPSKSTNKKTALAGQLLKITLLGAAGTVSPSADCRAKGRFHCHCVQLAEVGLRLQCSRY